MNSQNLINLIENIETRNDLVSFLKAFYAAHDNHSVKWDNNNLSSFLEALSAWVNDMDGYYKNKNIPIPKSPTWKMFAEMLMAATMYE